MQIEPGILQIDAGFLQIEIIPPQIKKAAKAHPALSQLRLRKIDINPILISPHNIVILKILAYQYITILLRIDGYDPLSVFDKVNRPMMYINLIKTNPIPIDKFIFIIVI
ncbi:hypothetical protein ABE66_06315 [Cytobacillus firmus]|nr:hypothetical protein [Cytobacillus firmus]